ncbi:hypothetical protein [Microvirga aerophila]|uniref:hypothetical protein n=1 Tax=Microvirga aerophila TaxID=670291 RepID=UPI000DEF09B7|nr:hypothetical protein [Microvirga aerophila]
MPFSQNPVVEWAAELYHLLQGLQIATGANGNRYGRLDVDVNRETLFLINDFEARVRQRRVRLRLADKAEECLVGEMNPLIGLGAAADPTQHISKVRISFYNV